MLRITISSDELTICFRLEGKVVGLWAEEVEQVWSSTQERRQGKICLVDLSDVSFVDEAGRKALAHCHAEGAQFKASGPLTSYLVESITRQTSSHPPELRRGAAQGKS